MMWGPTGSMSATPRLHTSPSCSSPVTAARPAASPADAASSARVPRSTHLPVGVVERVSSFRVRANRFVARHVGPLAWWPVAWPVAWPSRNVCARLCAWL